MSIKQDYFQYLKHFAATVPVCQLYQQPHNPDMVALRHDVDYDLDLALEMAYWEHENACRATYYLLHTADYWRDPRLIEKCLQLQDFGHEVGLHLNVLAEWMSGRIDDIRGYLEGVVRPLRTGGVQITGFSTHGDTACYAEQFINYWCFSELRPDAPQATESGLSAEGIADDDPAFQISYPSSGTLRRSDGKQCDLWSVSMESLKLSYDAMHVHSDCYFTDSGGRWKRSPDPLLSDLSGGRHQILMHPVYWKGPQKFYFFLSTARCGSKWLVDRLNRKTSLTVRHEFTLNHAYRDHQLVEDKRTSHGFTELVQHRSEAKELIHQSRDNAESSGGDYAEANVYLERFAPELVEVFPEACLIHLYRDPADVVRSIMNRNWYDTPEDCAHPRFDIANFDYLPQFIKACWYVRKTNETLLALCRHRIQFETMVRQPEYLASKLREWNIPYYPRLADPHFYQVVDPNTTGTFPSYRDWPAADKEAFHTILSPVYTALQYDHYPTVASESLFTPGMDMPVPSLPPKVLDLPLKLDPAAITCRACAADTTAAGLAIVPEGGGNAHALLGGGAWYVINATEGWPSQRGYYFRGSLTIEAAGTTDRGSLFCLMYSQEGKLIHKRAIGIISHSAKRLNFSFRLLPETRRFNLAIYLPAGTFHNGITVKDARLQAVQLQ